MRLCAAGAVYVHADDCAYDIGGHLLLLLTCCVQTLHAGLQLQSASHYYHACHGCRLLLPLRPTTRKCPAVC